MTRRRLPKSEQGNPCIGPGEKVTLLGSYVRIPAILRARDLFRPGGAPQNG